MKENHRLLYHPYLIFYDKDVKEAVALAYGVSIQRDVLKKREVLLQDVDFSYLSDVMGGVGENVFRNTTNVQPTEEEDDKSPTYLWPMNSIDARIEAGWDSLSA